MYVYVYVKNYIADVATSGGYVPWQNLLEVLQSLHLS